MMNKTILALVTVVSALAAVPAYADQLDFDCDVPADHFSSVSQSVTDGGRVSGLIRLDQMRKGRALPVAGVGFFDPEKQAIAGFQLVASDAYGKSLDIMFNVAHDGGLQKEKVGEIDASSAIAFDISLSSSGKVALTVNGREFQAGASAISSGRAMAFCSTAQFKFTNLLFSASGDGSEG
jgi:hypothetical protein